MCRGVAAASAPPLPEGDNAVISQVIPLSKAARCTGIFFFLFAEVVAGGLVCRAGVPPPTCNTPLVPESKNASFTFFAAKTYDPPPFKSSAHTFVSATHHRTLCLSLDFFGPSTLPGTWYARSMRLSSSFCVQALHPSERQIISR